MSCSPERRPPALEGGTEGVDGGQGDGDGGGWTDATASKRRRQAERPRFVVCLDDARRGRPVRRALVMATRPQAEPLFPGCSDTESDASDDAADDGSPRRSPKFVLADVQSLLSYVLLTNRSLQSPRWCRVIKPNCIPRLLLVILDGAAPADAARLPSFLGHFFQAMRLLSPYACGEAVTRVLFNLPLQSVVKGERELLEARLAQPQPSQPPHRKSGAAAQPAEAAVGSQVEPPPQEPAAFPHRDNFPRTDLLLSSVQLLHENFPIPGLRSGSSRSTSYRNSRPDYRPAGPASPLYGLDCEMVVTEGGPAGAQQLELARATLVDEAGRVLLDRLVMPPSPVINYVTAKSGITREMLDGVTTTLEEVQAELSALLPPDAILVGHSLNCDLHALRMCHPSCIDTSVIYNLSGSRRHKAGLRVLAQRFLGRDIQADEAAGHSSAEDALAALELVQLKLARSLEFGDAASGHWNPAAAGAEAEEGAPAVKRLRLNPPADAADAAGHPGDFHASLSSRSCSASLFDWLRLHGASFRVFDGPRPARTEAEAADACPLSELPSAYLARSPGHAAAVEAARAEVKCSRLVVLRLTGVGAAGLAALDGPLDRLYEALPASSLSVVLLTGAPGEVAGGAGCGKCYFNLKGMTKPQSLVG